MKKILSLILLSFSLICAEKEFSTTHNQNIYSQKQLKDIIHVYAPIGVDPNDPNSQSPDEVSEKYKVMVNSTDIPTFRLKEKENIMDFTRFASNNRTPIIKITLIDNTVINSVQIHPIPYYPEKSIEISKDKKTLTFHINDKLPYALVMINGDATSTVARPYLAIINDPLEKPEDIPDRNANNVLDFKKFSEEYLKKNPIQDNVGEKCLNSATIQDYSKNNGELMTWTHSDGYFVPTNANNVRFPNRRVRVKDDLTDALNTALDKIKKDPKLNTLYFPAGRYVWAGLQIKDWNGDVAKGGKPLYIYLEEGALLENRMQECREALEPAILFKNCSHITVSGRGIIDGRGTMNGNKDREDAAISPHQGGVMLIHSNNITFNDTYVRDTKQWNWECHTVENIYYNNIKGMSPYSRPWIDGLNITSGKNVYVNGAFTMGNDDCFASGHYNPSDEFPRRIFSQNLTEYINDHNVMAAAYYYNRDRLKWDTKDSENINLKNTLHFSLFANGIRTGANTRIGNETANSNRGRKLKSYFFDNVHSVNSGSGQIRFQIESMNSYPDYESIVIKNSSFWGTDPNMAQLPPGRSPYNPKVANVIFENVWFNSTYPMMKFDGIKRITLSNLHFAGILLENTSQTPGINITDACDNVEFTANGKSLHYSYKSDNK